jgi:hypothetical protein
LVENEKEKKTGGGNVFARRRDKGTGMKAPGAKRRGGGGGGGGVFEVKKKKKKKSSSPNNGRNGFL